MLTTTELKEYAQLTQATYAYFTSSAYKNGDSMASILTKEGGAPDLGANFTGWQADIFKSRYELLHQSNNADPDGFSAALFRDKSTGRLVLSFRGTEPFGTQIVKDLLMADLRIGTDGYASPQAIAMYRYIKQLTTPAGQAVQYSAAEMAGLKAIYLDRADTATELATRTLDWSSVESGLAADKGIDAGQGAGALIPAGASLDFTGHSLGGHLAMLASRLFPGLASKVVTLNAPGFFPQSEAVLDLFSADWANGIILRMEAAGDGVSELGSVYPGTRVLLGQENETGAIAPFLTNHDKVNAADGLALTELMGKLDPRFAADARLAKVFLDQASAIPKQSYETLLDGLRRMILGGGIASTPFNDEFKPISRGDYYKNISTLAANAAFQSLAGKVTLATPSTSATVARSDFGQFLALYYLAPFALQTTDTGAIATLKSANPTLADQWSADAALSQANRDAGKANYSDAWLDDRAKLLGWLLQANASDTDHIANPGNELWIFRDETSGQSVAAAPRDGSVPPAHYVIFGKSGADNLTGGEVDDRLYGGLGYDVLDGGKGNDYLEGNGGNDNLKGGEGRDTLVGGAGEDELAGGVGNDTLKGGLDSDTYEFAGDWGADAIEDIEGEGQITIGGTPLTGANAKKTSESTWRSDDGRVSYSLVDAGISRRDLIITVAGSDAGSIVVRDWSNGELGVDLPAQDTPAQPSNTFIGDFRKATNPEGTRYRLGADGNYESAGDAPGAADLITGSNADDLIEGLGGDDFLSGSGGNDIIDGGDGNDYLLDGLGVDRVNGGAGDDIIFLSLDGPIDYPVRTDFDPPQPGQGELVASGFSWIWEAPSRDPEGFRYSWTTFYGVHPQSTEELLDDGGNVVNAGAGEDQVLAGTGDDTVHGGEDRDEIFGLDGSDVLYGDAGVDRIFGDSPVVIDPSYPIEDTAPEQHGNDIISGGSGNDILLGQGANDEIYGGADDDKLWGDDRYATDTPGSIHGSDWLDGGEGNDELAGGGRDDVLYGGIGNDKLWGDVGAAGPNAPGWIDPSLHGDDFLDGEDGNDYLQGEGGDDILIGGDGDDQLLGDDDEDSLPAEHHGNDVLLGEAGNDQLSGNGGDDTLDGGTGSDLLEGGEGNDALRGGGGGLDLLHGGAGDDTYVLDDQDGVTITPNGATTLYTGAGVSLISDASGNNRIVFGAGIGRADLQFITLPGNAASYQLKYGADLVQIENGLVADPIASFVLADGSVLDRAAIFETAPALDITGSEGGDQLMGGNQADALRGAGGADILRGGKGNDLLVGGAGDDEYRYQRGDGQDTIDNGEAAPAHTDALVLGADIAAADLILRRNLDDLQISLRDSSDSITVSGHFAGAPLNRLRFADGMVWDEAQIATRLVRELTEGNDVVTGTDGADTLLALGGDDSINGIGGDDYLDGGPGRDTLYGGRGNDQLFGQEGNDDLFGQDGNDTLAGGAGDDRLVGADGADLLEGGAGADTLEGGNDNDVLRGEAGNDLLMGGAGDDRLDGAAGADTLQGGIGNDTFVLRAGENGVTIYNYDDATGSGVDVIEIAGLAPAGIRAWRNGDDLLLGTAAANGSADLATVVGYFSADAAGSMTPDQIRFDDGTAWSIETVKAMVGTANELANTLYGYASADAIDGLGGDDSIFGREGDDTLDGGSGEDKLYGEAGNDTVRGGAGKDFLDGGAGTDLLEGGDGGDRLVGAAGDDDVRGGAGDDVLAGGANPTASLSGALVDSSPEAGNDVLTGGAGNDSMFGSLGDDVYVYGNGDGADQVIESGGLDTIRFLSGITPADVSLFGDGKDLFVVVRSSFAGLRVLDHVNDADKRIERIEFSDGAVWTATDIAARTQSGTPNAMTGTAGNDTFTVDDVRDTVTEAANGGTDEITTSVDFTLPGNVEILSGIGVLNLTLTGNALDNTIRGTDNNNVLDGRDGTDTLVGGKGDDTYYIGSPKSNGATQDSDVVIESPAAGTDTVVIADYNYSAAENVERIRVVPLAYARLDYNAQPIAREIVGNASDNDIEVLPASLTGGNEPIRLDGGAGADTMLGRQENDVYVVDRAEDVIVELGSASSIDAVESLVSYALTPELENLTLRGSAAITATGHAGANILDGSLNGAANVLSGLSGNDIYVVGAGDTVVEAAGAGNDTVQFAWQQGGVYDARLTGADEIERYALPNFNLASQVLIGTDRAETIENASWTYGPSGSSGPKFGGSIQAGGGDDRLTGSQGSDRLDGGSGADIMDGNWGSDTFVVDNVGDQVIAYTGTDTVETSVGYVLPDEVENGMATGGAAIGITGNALGNTLDGRQNAAGNILAGGAGDDIYYLGVGDTVVEFAGGGEDTVYADHSHSLQDNVERGGLVGAANTTLTGNGGANVLTGNDGDNTLLGGAGDDTLVAGAGNDTLDGGIGSDVYSIQEGSGTVTVSSSDATAGKVDVLQFAASDAGVMFARVGNDLLLRSTTTTTQVRVVDYYATVNPTRIERFDFWGGVSLTGADVAARVASAITGTAAGETINGTVGNDLILALAGDDTVNAGAGDDNISGDDGNDRLDGGSGADSMSGGSGNDVFIVDNVLDAVREYDGDGIDEVDASVSYTLGYATENLVLIGTSGLAGTGNAGANRLLGNSGSNTLTGLGGDDFLDGAAGNDTMVGGAGNDQYVVGSTGDLVVENFGEGTDTVSAGVAYTLGTNVENLLLTGSSAINGTGNALDNLLVGNASANTLDGLAGADTMRGGGGDDTYVVDRTPAFYLDWDDTLGVGIPVYADSTTGNWDTVEENPGEGTDTVRSAISYVLGANVENLILGGTAEVDGKGNGLNNVISGNAVHNFLDGAGGADTLRGGAGDDTYLVDTALDVVIENAGEGYDTVIASVSYTLGANVEELGIIGVTDANLTGNDLANGLYGNAGNNVLAGGAGDDYLDGGPGNDTLDGGLGNDTYFVGALDAGVTTIASADATAGKTDTILFERASTTASFARNGADLVFAFDGSTANVVVKHYFGAPYPTRIERFEFSDGVVWTPATIAAQIPLATSGDDVITGTDGDDTVNALGGNDVVYGGTGNDTLDGGDGSDTLYGEAGIDRLIGGNGDDALDGGIGSDTLIGGPGNDTYVVDASTDVVTEALNEGTDRVQSAVSYAIGVNVENLTLTGTAAINGTGNSMDNVLTGNSANNTLTGGDGNDTLDGGAGTDTMVGGLGNDTYTVDVSADVVTEAVSAGTDTVLAGVTLTLAANVENLTLTGTGAINGTGNTQNNVLTGNAANNVLDGGTGSDTLIGGAGNDTYVVDAAGDVVTENASEGTDLVQSNATYTLSANVENLTLTGTTAINGTGNALDNVLTGNSAANTLTGGAGNDTLSGAAGADTMIGGAGNDTYVVDVTTDVVTEALNEGTDLVQSAVTYTIGANVENLTLTGTTAINGTGNALDNVLTGNGANNTLTGGDGNDALNGGAGTDTMVGGLGNDTYTVDVSTDVVTEAASAGTDTVLSSVTLTLATNVENLMLTGMSAINGTGNALANLVRGNAAVNTLNGGTGNDLLEGADGNDILTDTSGTAWFNGGAGTDTITGGTSAEIFVGGLGNDTFNTSTGADIILVNKGDGSDIVNGGTGTDNVVSLGGGIRYSDLKFRKATNDLILDVSATESITFKNWYVTTANNKSVAKLQVILDATADYNAASADPTLNKKVEQFDFAGLATKFDQALVATPSLTSWALTNALSTYYLTSSSDTAALGGDLAYYYGKNGSVTGMTTTAAQDVIGNASLGTANQTLRAFSGISGGSSALM